jgi:two-component system phosphate regulon response regulator PhoB
MDELTDSTGRELHHLTVAGEFLLDRETIRVWRGNKALRLSMRQFRLLDAFMRHPGEPISLRALKDLVWGPESTVAEATVATEIMRLRRAIGGRKRDAPLRTVRKLGYVFDPPKRRAAIKQNLSISDASPR